MEKYLFTFGSAHLKDFEVNPQEVLLVVEGEHEHEARAKVFGFKGIEDKFCTSYPGYHEKKKKKRYNMVEFSLEQLENLRIEEKANERL